MMVKPDSLSPDWLEKLSRIPGYDPIRGAVAIGAEFDTGAADDACAFFRECLQHIEGAMEGKPFVLEGWQESILCNLFGWKIKNADGRWVRRYREMFLYVPRKNGKTPFAAGICNFVLFCDQEPGAQIYSAAADTDQATLLFRQARGMVDREPELSERAVIYGGVGQRSIALKEDRMSVYRVISADANTKHGGNTHLALIDELHAQPNRDLVDVLQTSMASKNRVQPLLIHITTADFDRESICNEKYDYAGKVRDGVIEDSSFLPVIFEASPDDDWTSPAVWRKANPNLGVSVSEEYLARECQRAKETPTYENTFKRLHLNIRTQNDVRWISVEAWDKSAGLTPWGQLEGVLLSWRCFAGLDLSTKIDITAFVMVFPPQQADTPYRVLPRFWMPEDNARVRERRDRVPYLTWARQGLITLTPGNVVDYDRVKADIAEDAKRFDIQQIAYDPWNATQIALQLGESGANMVEFGQGFKSMSEPTKELEKLVMAGEFEHGGNPVLRWMASNVAVETDPAGNIKPSKKKSTERIDGIVGSVMGLGLAITNEDAPSPYETRGIRTL